MLLAINLSGGAVVLRCYTSDVWSKCVCTLCLLYSHPARAPRACSTLLALGCPIITNDLSCHNLPGSLEITDRLLARGWILRDMVAVSSQLCAVPAAFARHGGGRGGCEDRPGTGQGGGSRSGAPRGWAPKALGAPRVASMGLGLRGLWRERPAAGQALVCEYRKQKAKERGCFMHRVAVITDLDSWQR